MSRPTAYEAARRSPPETANQGSRTAPREPGAHPDAYASARALLDRLRAGGVSVTLEPDGLVVDPWPRVSDADRAQLRALRDAIVDYLTDDRYVIEPEPEPEPEPPPPKVLARDLTADERRAVRLGRRGLIRTAGGAYVESEYVPSGIDWKEIKNLMIRSVFEG